MISDRLSKGIHSNLSYRIPREAYGEIHEEISQEGPGKILLKSLGELKNNAGGVSKINIGRFQDRISV